MFPLLRIGYVTLSNCNSYRAAGGQGDEPTGDDSGSVSRLGAHDAGCPGRLEGAVNILALLGARHLQ